ncbi:hypothetical protein AZ036_004839 [Klebsiella michiganensis]|nr:hypothetical protein L387_04783 [Klebsiella michiganensis]OUG37581.1 hypothetical protein AZ036_004839 [Klebsiella michiganensis]
MPYKQKLTGLFFLTAKVLKNISDNTLNPNSLNRALTLKSGC